MSATRRTSLYHNVLRTLRVRDRHTECAVYTIDCPDRHAARAVYIRHLRCAMLKCTLLFFSATMLSVASFAAVKAQESAGPAELRFRRVYAPANRINDWPTGEGKYLPLESDEFQRLLGLVPTGAPEDRSSFSSRITAAEYQAQLSGEQLLSGRATLEITHSGKSPGMLPLEPCNAAIHKTAWDLPGQDAKIGKGDSPIFADHASMVPEKSGKSPRKNRGNPRLWV